MILEIVETVGGFGALAVVAHKIEMAMLARHGYDTRDFFKPLRREPPIAVEITDPWPEMCRLAERNEQRLYAACPSAFWLNPDGWDAPPRPAIEGMMAEHEAVLARHGVLVPKQTFRAVMPPLTDLPRSTVIPDSNERAAPMCPVCKVGRRTVMAVHGGEATMWDCFDCGAEFTRKGETKSSKKRRQAKALTEQMRDLEARRQRIDLGLEGYLEGMPPPPAV